MRRIFTMRWWFDSICIDKFVTDMNTATLIRLYPMMSNKRIAEILGVSVSHVGVTAHRLGLKKNAGYLSEVNRKNVHG